MRILVDTHVLIWYIEGNEKLTPNWRSILSDPRNLKMVSIASIWEIAIKTNLQKLNISYPLDKLLPVEFQILDLQISHLIAYQNLPLHHRDPFDRILVAQAQIEDLSIMTVDPNIHLYDVSLFSHT